MGVGAVAIFVDGRNVGSAAFAHLDVRVGRVILEGLDGLARLFFVSWVGPVGPDPAGGAPLGGVTIRDADGRWIDAPQASVFSLSSGVGEVGLFSRGLRTTTQAPRPQP